MKGGREERGGECALACFESEDSQGARDREECKRRGSVLGDTFWRGEREVVRREEGTGGGKKSSGVDSKAGQAVRETGRGVRSHWEKEGTCWGRR